MDVSDKTSAYICVLFSYSACELCFDLVVEAMLDFVHSGMFELVHLTELAEHTHRN